MKTFIINSVLKRLVFIKCTETKLQEKKVKLKMCTLRAYLVWVFVVSGYFISNLLKIFQKVGCNKIIRDCTTFEQNLALCLREVS